jgi:hypothetical protein
MMRLDSLLSQFAGVISGFDLGAEIGPHSLGFGSSSSAMSWMRETSGRDAGGPAFNKGGNTFNLTGVPIRKFGKCLSLGTQINHVISYTCLVPRGGIEPPTP